MSFMPFGFCKSMAVVEEEEPAAALFPPEDYSDTDFTWFAITTPTDSNLVNMFWSDPNIFIDWGDGNSESLNAAGSQVLGHTYATAGSYLVKMSGSCTQCKFNNSAMTGKLVAFYTKFQGFTLTDAQYMFANCALVSSFPDGLFSGLPGITNYTKVFNRCYALTAIGDILPTPTTTAPNFLGMFQQATALVTVHADFFSKINSTAHPTANFLYVFRLCSGITSDVPDLWTDYGSTYGNGKHYAWQSANIGNLGSIPDWWVDGT